VGRLRPGKIARPQELGDSAFEERISSLPHCICFCGKAAVTEPMLLDFLKAEIRKDFAFGFGESSTKPKGNWGACIGDRCSWLPLNAGCSHDQHWCSRLIRLISLSAWKDLVYSHLTICYGAFSLSTVKQIQMLENCTIHESSEYGENNCHFPKMQQSKMLYISI